MKKWITLIVTLIITSSILSGCSNSKSLYSDEGQVFRKVIPQDMTTLDTTMISDAVSGDIAGQSFEGLYSMNKHDKAEPAIATSLPKKSKDGKTLTVDLRKDAKWSNGDPVTADDFVFAWRKVANPKTASEFAYIMSDIKNADDINAGKKPVKDLGIKALNKYKLQINLERPVPYINELLALNTFDPQNEKVAKKYGKAYGTTADKAVYNGPFKVVNWKVEDKIQLEKNNQYWDKKHVKLDRVNYKILKDNQAGAALYDTNSVDDAIISSEQVDKYKKSPALRKRLTAATFYIKLNEKEVPEFKNKHLRLAIAQAINRKEYVDSVFNDGSLPSSNFTGYGTATTPSGKDFASTIKSPLKYNKHEAADNWKKAQKELGKKNVTFTLNVQDTPVQKISAEFIKSQLETNLPGVEVKVKQLPFKQKINLELSNNYQASYAGWSPDYPDPMAFLEIMKTGNPQNNTDWGNKEYDQLIKDANGKLLQEPEKRNEALQQAEKILLENAPVTPIYQKGEAHLTNPQVKGLVYHKVGPDTTLKDVYIDKSIDRETGKKKK
ncbi:oligopeptide transport system substrate-binding protein [Staphylococcus pasteuri]|uniref:Oligopeptide transport system substrate-binding protein n=2 Tax=Staphylococcus TaxID=1279 RepID=A0ABY1H264_9STAP|nr:MULTISPECIES: peptide ABC transporter substrate-binding protein [Staphylococcus]ATH63030.1 peptide ABC transporter substrate-binding protein [Staphylococcus pasteuri]KKI56949.1 Oligopeptide ABC transporter, periplasmic oligopeptide-binding protein OppA [Staphylococcus pasteuri]MCF7598714.1 peptide ABC transporter substrate-binding protein [Staphylococcus pasteuri]MDI3231083.1 peptide ABC transporter substrate-binding protein [Staphylococcus pasteuri]MDO6574186.1 peptide ABC transporter subs